MCREPLSGHAVTSRIDYEVLAVNEAEPPQLVEQREMMRRVAWTGVQAADAISPPGFLRARRERPRDRSAAEQRDELAPFQWQRLPCFQPEDTTARDLLHCGISSGLMVALWVNSRCSVIAHPGPLYPRKRTSCSVRKPRLGGRRSGRICDGLVCCSGEGRGTHCSAEVAVFGRSAVAGTT